MTVHPAATAAATTTTEGLVTFQLPSARVPAPFYSFVIAVVDKSRSDFFSSRPFPIATVVVYANNIIIRLSCVYFPLFNFFTRFAGKIKKKKRRTRTFCWYDEYPRLARRKMRLSRTRPTRFRLSHRARSRVASDRVFHAFCRFCRCTFGGRLRFESGITEN